MLARIRASEKMDRYLSSVTNVIRMGRANVCVPGIGQKKEATQRGKTASPLSLVTVLTTVTENREQEVMLSSPVSLAPSTLEQSRCQAATSTHIGYVTPGFIGI